MRLFACSAGQAPDQKGCLRSPLAPLPARLDFLGKTHAQVNHAAIAVLKKCKEVEENDLVILTKGDLMGVDGGTNAMKVLRVGHMMEEEEDPEHGD